MKYALVFVAAGLVAAQDFGGQPSCALPCLQTALPQVGCALQDTACQCTPEIQAALLPIVGPCLLSSCGPAEVAQAQSAAGAACSAFLATATGSATPTASQSDDDDDDDDDTSASQTSSAVPTSRVTNATSAISSSIRPASTATGGSGAAATPVALAGAAMAAILGVAAAL
ncbi:hypothetical protein HYQ45_008763 [Verticillium longisporum]|uniref:CFEM domain-containing protein n=1 Tax=Verticillium longisporum TaxID=100787 RepID=A0A0G4MGV1_VERLO|nr:hypothetical protein HYQ44_011688 [Verticillium longisporum]KAG7132966.1 hypothetical protein HYQ45_008763 [Verticillium longisporum]CRK33481.1 hypothetical protein BN1708_001159 [Verticillium longisporum]CRK44777.1 hypothetical protein BN1723_006303 [Verticillium longisporum]